jgi:hypothetical protein
MPKKRNKQRRRRQSAGSSMPKPPPGLGPVFHLRRTFLITSPLLVAGSPDLRSWVLVLNSLPSNFLGFVTEFDLFRIRGARIRFIPRWNVAGTSTDEIPQISYVANYDDTTPPSSQDYVLGQRNSRTVPFCRTVTLRTAPHGLTAQWASSGSFPYTTLTPRGQWMNTAAFVYATAFPLAKTAITAVANFPANGIYDVYYDVDFDFLQSLSG